MDAAGLAEVAGAPLVAVLVLYPLVRRSARRRVNRGRAAYPTALAVTTGWIWVSEQRPNGRTRRRQPRATLVLLPDRLIAVPTRGDVVDIPLSSLDSAAWQRTARGRRTVAMLQLQPVNPSQQGTPVFVDNVLGADTAEFARAITDLLRRWLPTDRAPGEPPRFLVRTRRQRITWTAVTIGLGVLPLPAIIGLTSLFGITAGAASADPVIPGAPGYYTVRGPHGKPLTVGSPWGATCSPVVVVTLNTVPASVYRVIARMVHTARAEEVNIVMARRDGTFPTSRLYTATGQPIRAHGVTVVPGNTTSPGSAAPHHQIGWDAEITPDGRHEQLTYLQDTFYLSTLHGHPVMLRKVVRSMIGFSMGVATSTRPGSAFSEHLADAADRFSPSDVHAMLVMSGCAPYAPHQ